MPIRIQRLRSKDWKMPENTRYVGRPTVFGNPYKVDVFGRDLCLALFTETVRGFWIPNIVKDLSDDMVDIAYDLHHTWLARMGHHPEDTIRYELRGKDLACWCPLYEKCHADILL